MLMKEGGGMEEGDGELGRLGLSCYLGHPVGYYPKARHSQTRPSFRTRHFTTPARYHRQIEDEYT